MDEKQKRGFPPVLQASGKSLSVAWENTVLELADKGLVYLRGDPDDLGEQIEAVMRTTVENPDAEPFSHRKGGTNAIMAPLLDYYMEIMGAKDSWVKDFSDPTDQRWDYMYHERLGSWPSPKSPSDQIEWAIKRLIERPFSRRTNIITWYPPRDMEARHTPCLQRLWFQIVPGGLDMHDEFRSRNALNASFGNLQGLYILGCHVRDKVEEATGQHLNLRMIDYTNSFHVSSHDYSPFLGVVKDIRKMIGEGKGLEERTFTRDLVVQTLVEDREQVESVILRQTEKHFPGDMGQEKERVHAIGDRIFYLLEKYGDKKYGS